MHWLPIELCVPAGFCAQIAHKLGFLVSIGVAVACAHGTVKLKQAEMCHTLGGSGCKCTIVGVDNAARCS